MVNPERLTRLTTARGLDLHCRVWRSRQPTLGVLVLVHGLGEHLGRYDSVATALNQAGITVAGFDLPGHGRSAGQRGHINHWQDYRQSLQQFVTVMATQFPSAPLFLMGHSLGAMIALDFAMQDWFPLQGLIISGTPLVPTSVQSPIKVLVVRLLSPIFPRLSLKTGVQPAALSRDRMLLERDRQDALIHNVATLRWGAEMLDAIARIKANPNKISHPVLMMHGDCDTISAIAGAQTFFDAIPAADKTFNIYPGSHHEPHNDLDADQVMSDLTDWIKGQTIKTRQIG
ncbi:MAG: lysophospholipase [Cyanobacteria bacterium J06639_16]